MAKGGSVVSWWGVVQRWGVVHQGCVSPCPFTPLHPAALGLQVAAPEPDLAQRLAELKNSK